MARPPSEGPELLHSFTVDRATGLPGPEWLRRRRTDALDAMAVMPMPSEKEEVWRYTPIDRLSLDDYAPVLRQPGGADGYVGEGTAGTAGDAADRAEVAAMRAFVDGLSRDLGGLGALVVVRDGWPVSIDRRDVPTGVGLRSLVASSPLQGEGAEELLGSVLTGGDALVRLNDAFHPDAVVIDVAPGTVVSAPLVVVHWCSGSTAAATGPASSGRASLADEEREQAPGAFPRTFVRAGRNAEVGVVEVVAGAPGRSRGLVVPVTELVVDDGGRLSYVFVQDLGEGAWHLARLAGVAGRDATIRTFTVGLGGAYDRSRTDAALTGQGGSSELRSAYLGTGDQVHDVRTLQDHRAPHTTSDLLCKGAVAAHSRSVYTGLIRVCRGAVRTEALQTNHNLVLDRHAHADSVPNLDIEENDVRCSHASTVGPLDDDQRFYLESRGVPPERAERLIVLGFFDDILVRSPVPAVLGRLRRAVADRLTAVLGDPHREAAGEVAEDDGDG